MILLLSITKKGLISLWDTPESRLRGTDKEERFIDLPLTPKQVMMIEKWKTAELRLTLEK